MTLVLLLTTIMLEQVKKPLSHYFTIQLIPGKLWVDRLVLGLRLWLFWFDLDGLEVFGSDIADFRHLVFLELKLNFRGDFVRF